MKYKKAYGFADFNKKTPLKIDDKFSTMSIAKQFTATLILQEVEKGRIDLQTPIRKYLPDFKYSWADTVTVHQLLNNTSGLHSENMDKPLKFKPGTAFSYSNVGYYVAGLVLEKQSGKSFETLVTALFKKCKMNNSYYPNEKNSQLLVNDKADIYEIGHTGFHPSEGFTAVNLYYPKTKTSVVVMENTGNENFDIAYYFPQEVRKIMKESTLLK